MATINSTATFNSCDSLGAKGSLCLSLSPTYAHAHRSLHTKDVCVYRSSALVRKINEILVDVPCF